MSGLLSWPNAVSVYQIYGGAEQFQLVAPTNIATQTEGPAIADRSAYLIDPDANRYHRYVVPYYDRVELRGRSSA